MSRRTSSSKLARSWACPFLLGTGVALVLGASVVQAATRHLEQGAKEFLQGELDGLALDDLGRLSPAPVELSRYETESLYVWSLALDSKGRLWVGTGDGGTIYRLEKDALVAVAKTLSLEILSLLPREHDLLAGSNPDGVVYRVQSDGTVAVALDVPQQSIWALADGSRPGSWLAGTGPGARIYRAGKGAEAGELLHELPATNLTVLRRDESGLWVGTQGPALIYRILGEDSSAPHLLYEAAEPEIRSIVADGEGGAFVLALDSGESSAQNGEPSPTSRIVWLEAEGGQEEVYRGKESLISLLRLSDGAFLAGEAKTGRLLRIDRSGRRTLWAELDGGDPLALLQGPGGVLYAGTGNLGAVYRLGPSEGGQGSFQSTVLEMVHAARWGRLRADMFGKRVRFRTRSGVRRDPDESWSEWSDFQEMGAVVTSPLAPYLQYELQLEDARVSTVSLAYAERNLPPRLTQLRVESTGGRLASGGLQASPSPVSQRFDDGLGVEYSIYQARKSAEPEQSAWARGIRTVVWKAKDPNEDSLLYRLELRRLPDGEWSLLAEDLDREVYAWDTRSYEDGPYRLRVTASDRRENPPGLEREDSLVSAALHVDNQAPRFGKVGFDDSAHPTTLRLQVQDDQSPLSQVDLRFDGGGWIPLQPIDGVIDHERESFEVDLRAALRRAESPTRVQQIRLRAVDRAGNVDLTDLGLPPGLRFEEGRKP